MKYNKYKLFISLYPMLSISVFAQHDTNTPDVPASEDKYIGIEAARSNCTFNSDEDQPFSLVFQTTLPDGASVKSGSYYAAVPFTDKNGHLRYCFSTPQSSQTSAERAIPKNCGPTNSKTEEEFIATVKGYEKHKPDLNLPQLCAEAIAKVTKEDLRKVERSLQTANRYKNDPVRAANACRSAAQSIESDIEDALAEGENYKKMFGDRAYNTALRDQKSLIEKTRARIAECETSFGAQADRYDRLRRILDARQRNAEIAAKNQQASQEMIKAFSDLGTNTVAMMEKHNQEQLALEQEMRAKENQILQDQLNALNEQQQQAQQNPFTMTPPTNADGTPMEPLKPIENISGLPNIPNANNRNSALDQAIMDNFNPDGSFKAEPASGEGGGGNPYANNTGGIADKISKLGGPTKEPVVARGPTESVKGPAGGSPKDSKQKKFPLQPGEGGGAAAAGGGFGGGGVIGGGGGGGGGGGPGAGGPAAAAPQNGQMPNGPYLLIQPILASEFGGYVSPPEGPAGKGQIFPGPIEAETGDTKAKLADKGNPLQERDTASGKKDCLDGICVLQQRISDVFALHDELKSVDIPL